MRPEHRPTLIKSSKLVAAGGSGINGIGKGNFKVRLGPVSVETEVIVAEIEDGSLFGVDFLQNRADGPTDILMSKWLMKMAE